MRIVILDSCCFTPLGLSDIVNSERGYDREIQHVRQLTQLPQCCHQYQPNVVFINEDCLPTPADSQQIKEIIDNHPQTLFFIFMAIPHVRFEEHIVVRSNVVITSKSVKKEVIKRILSSYFACKNISNIKVSRLDMSPVMLSRCESRTLRMWMSGEDTLGISDKLCIKAKTVSSYKGSIKRKIKTQNQQAIYHLVRLSEQLTEGIYVN
jgi:LuxR family capsular biosynthesis transcriptional activator